MISTSRNIINWINKRNKVPVFKRGYLPDIETFYKTNTESDDLFAEEIADSTFDAEIGKLEVKGLFELEVEYFDESFIEDVNSDIAILEQIQESWFGKDKITPDPKRDHFAEIVSKLIHDDPIRKIVVFSSYADTVDDLYEKLKSSGLRVIKYTSKDPKTVKDKIKHNFDAGIKEQLQENDFDILVATDAISEGYNLHRAGTVFNYDIPYNPTRVIQRVGRINRINKKVFDRLYIYNYFPTSVGEHETRTKEISTLKMAMINAIIGEDTKVLTGDIELRSFFADQYRKMAKADEVENWETKYRELLNRAKGTKEYETALAIPHRSRVGRTAKKDKSGVLLFGRKKDTCIFKISKDLFGAEMLDPETALNLFEADILEAAKSVSSGFDAIYQNVKSMLFRTNETEKVEKQKRELLDKIKVIFQSGKLKNDYMKDLQSAAEMGALSGLAMQYIRQLKPSDYEILPEMINQDFLDRVTKMADDIDKGNESIILSEELL